MLLRGQLCMLSFFSPGWPWGHWHNAQGPVVLHGEVLSRPALGNEVGSGVFPTGLSRHLFLGKMRGNSPRKKTYFSLVALIYKNITTM